MNIYVGNLSFDETESSLEQPLLPMARSPLPE